MLNPSNFDFTPPLHPQTPHPNEHHATDPGRSYWSGTAE